MLTLRVDTIAKIVKGQLTAGSGPECPEGISINTRTIKKGEIFIAVPGKRYDGHRFIYQAIEKGASALIVHKRIKKKSCKIPVVTVDNTVAALGHLAAYYRRQFQIPIIAVTGSAGKTSTKELIASVLSQKFNVLKNERSENNHFGVPLTLLKLTHKHHVAVLEVGTSQKGDISCLGQIIKPDMLVFTNIGASHLEGLGSIRGVFNEKKSLIKFLTKKGQMILNLDDMYLKKLVGQAPSVSKMTYAVQQKADFQAKNLNFDNNNRIQFKVNRELFTLPTPAYHQVYNALAAIAVGRHFGLTLSDINKGLKTSLHCSGRQKIQSIGGVTIIDDTYNSNPLSFRSSINSLNTIHAKGKKILVGGDMLELGELSEKWHRQIGKDILHSSIDVFIGFGRNARFIYDECCRDGDKVLAKSFVYLHYLHRFLAKIIQPGDIVLIKGSRGMHLERTVNFLEENLSQSRK